MDIDQWQHCSCEEMSCNSCKAERVALEDHAGGYRDKASRSTNAELAFDRFLKAASDMHSSNRPLVRFDWPPGIMGDHVFICWFNESVSDSSLNGRTEFSYASPLIVYRFAHKFMLKPSLINRQELPERVLNQVCEAIEKGNTRYSELYPGAQRELTAKEILKAWPDIDMEVVARYHNGNPTAMEHIMRSIQQLLPNQVLLIVRESPYKVVSVVCTGNPDYVCMFDSQMHTISMVAAEGAMLLHSSKNTAYISEMLIAYQSWCFVFDGKCEIVVLQKK